MRPTDSAPNIIWLRGQVNERRFRAATPAVKRGLVATNPRMVEPNKAVQVHRNRTRTQRWTHAAVTAMC
jgi:hypothetical protein